MSLIFLDIDGVLNSTSFYKSRRKGEYSPTDDIDPKAVNLLNELCKEASAEIVISSTWRKGHTLDELRYFFSFHGFTGNIISVTPVGGAITCRGAEIKSWLYNSAPTFDYSRDYNKYVIIDDDSDFLLYQASHFIHVDTYYGITPNTVYRACRILSGLYETIG